ncbi:MAG TPA: O-antigen ligase family protein [Burkholderiales bacterium]|nr:O-antigen ligase family protein [Burkholderiales bacterium]
MARRAGRGAGMGLGIAGLALCAALAGIGVAVGEVEATVGVLSLVGVAAVLADFRIGAVLLILMMPIERSVYFPHSLFGIIGVNPLNALMLATLGSFLLRGRNLRGFLPRPLLWLVLVPVLFAGVLGLRHVDHIHPDFYEAMLINFTDAFGYFRDVAVKPLLLVLGALLIGAAVRQSQKPERFLVPVILSVWLMSLYSILYVAASGVSLATLASTHSREFFSVLGLHANDLGRLYAVAYALLLFTWGETRDLRLKGVLVVTMGVLTLALLFTFSRGAFVGFVIVNALFLLWKMNARTLGLALLLLPLALWLMPGAVIGRMSLGFGDGGDVNEVTAGRVDEIWLPLMPDLLHTPPWGNGLDSVMWSRAIWTGTMLLVTHPHNAYLQALLDMGVIGLVLLLAYYWHVFRNLKDLGSNAYLSPTLRGFFQGAVAGLACFLATGFAGSSLRPTAEFAFLWIAIGMMYGQLARRPTA